MIFSKNKTIILIVMIALISIAASGFVFARDLQVDYPQNGPTTTSIGLKGYISYIYRFIMSIAGVITFGALVFAGFQYLTSAGNPQAMTDAKKQMSGAVIGLLLLLGSHVLLSTINPKLVNLGPEALKPSSGVCLYEKDNAKGDFACYSGSAEKLPDGFEPESVEFISPRFSETEGGQTYRSASNIAAIYTFSNENWKSKITREANPKEDVNDSSNVWNGISPSAESFYLKWSKTGVWLYRKEDNELDFSINEPYQIYQTDVSELSNKYNNRVKSLHLKPFKCKKGSTITGLSTISSAYYPQVKYGTILHSQSDFEGECGIVLGEESIGNNYCSWTEVTDTDTDIANYGRYIHSINDISSLTVFNSSPEGNDSGEVTFYEQTGRSGDYFTINASNIGKFFQIKNLSYPLQGSVGGASVKDGDDALNDDRVNEILSMKVEGKFLVVVTRNQDFEGHCETNKKTTPTFNGHYVLRGDDDAKIHSIAIIPLQE